MSRETAFHVRGNKKPFPAAEPSKGFFGKNMKNFRTPQSQPVVHVSRNAVIRRQALRKLVADAQDGIATIAHLTELAEHRIRRLVEGEDVLEAPLAMHIEEMLSLPSGWMEDGDQPIPVAVMQKIGPASTEESQEPIIDESLFEDSMLLDDADMNAGSANGEDIFGLEAGAEVETKAEAEAENMQQAASSLESQKGKIEHEEDEAHADSDESSHGHDLHAVDNGDPDTGDADEIDERIHIAQKNMTLVANVFPAIRKYLADHTALSASTISGIITGSRGFPRKNQIVIEDALKQPIGWLREPHGESEIRESLRESLGAEIDRPAPRRGRQPSVSSVFYEKKPAQKPVFTPAASTVSIASLKPTPLHESSNAVSNTAHDNVAHDNVVNLKTQAPSLAASLPAKTLNLDDINDSTHAMGGVLIEMLQARLKAGRLDNVLIAKIMQALFL